jgi:hypothetical protein
MAEDHCPICGARHGRQQPCAENLLASGAERHAWRVNVETEDGIEAFGVLIAPCDDVWRARILTYPNVLWLAPGGAATLKFIGYTPQEAEQRAVEFIREHCQERGFAFRDEPPRVSAAEIPAEIRQGTAQAGQPAPRKVRFTPIRFGVGRPTELAGTGNLSETGLFILTEQPLRTGRPVAMALQAAARRVLDLSGRVVWIRPEPEWGRAPGMGVYLPAPPPRYVKFVRSLP